jgi:NAD(P)-dependent dehydrogenase (short-subunit alcohol dehydrogenase family)
VAPLDLADQTSVAAFVANWRGPLHALVNNAGIMATPLMRTPQGWEMQFATNHLGHFALATGLHDALAAAGAARVVSVSSVGHVNGGVDFDDLNFERRPYDPWVAYSQSKTANVLFAVEADKRWKSDGIRVNALNPGRIPATNLSRHMGDTANAPVAFEPNSTAVSWKTPAQGAATSVLLAASPLLDGVGGRYFEDCDEAEPHQPGVRRGVAAYALDPEAAARLWQVSTDTLAGHRS